MEDKWVVNCVSCLWPIPQAYLSSRRCLFPLNPTEPFQTPERISPVSCTNISITVFVHNFRTPFQTLYLLWCSHSSVFLLSFESKAFTCYRTLTWCQFSKAAIDLAIKRKALELLSDQPAHSPHLLSLLYPLRQGALLLASELLKLGQTMPSRIF